MSLIVHNVLIFTNDKKRSVLTDSAVWIAGNRIRRIGPEKELLAELPDKPRLDGRGRLLMPGLINIHMHFYSTFAKGLTLPALPRNFGDILKSLWWKLDASLDLDGVYYSALIPALSAVKQGITAVVDHHASTRAIDGSLDRIEEALSLVGTRGVLCFEVSDRAGRLVAEQGLRENERFLHKCRENRAGDADHCYDAMMGLHASFTLEDNTLARAAAVSEAQQRGCHIHVAEDVSDAQITREKFGVGLLERLGKFGVIGEKSLIGHGIHLTEREKDRLAETNTMVAHCPQSNMNNAVGRVDLPGLFQRGVLVGLGTDGMSPGLFAEARTANLIHKHDLQNSNAGWNEVQQMVLNNNPAIWERLTGQKLGTLDEGYLADMILVDYFPPTTFNGENFWGHFLFGIADAVVDTTIINGRIVMKNKQFPHVDEMAVAARARENARRTWERFRE